MKKPLLSFCYIFFLWSGILAQSKNINEEINRQANKINSQLISWRRYFHAHPELGNQEYQTADTIAKYLRSLGLDVKTGVAKTGVVAVLRGDKPGPVIALRADMDALPVTEKTEVPFASKVRTVYNGQETGVMHACGHDSHMAILMATAEMLTAMKSQLKGAVKFIFQPAEEGVGPGEEGGAELMVKEGVLENPKVEVIFGLHIQSENEEGTIQYRPGGTMAGVNDVKIIVRGRTAHGAFPWRSVDPIVVSAEIINNLQTIVSRNLNLTENPAVVSIGSIKGGIRSNIIPEQVELWGTLRSLSKSDEAMIIARVKQVATKTAESAGATAEVLIPYSSHYPITFNDSALVYKMLPSLQTAAGKSNVKMKPPYMAAEDFSFYEEKVPGFFFFLGGLPKGADPLKAPPHHSSDFYIDESGFIVGAKAFCQLVFDYSNMTK